MTQTVLAPGGELEAHHPVIGVVGNSPDEPGTFSSVDELDGAVVAEEKMPGYFADGWSAAVPAHRQEQLVLGGTETGLFRLPVAPPHEPP